MFQHSAVGQGARVETERQNQPDHKRTQFWALLLSTRWLCCVLSAMALTRAADSPPPLWGSTFHITLS